MPAESPDPRRTEKLSRRDWFRLRRPQPPSQPDVKPHQELLGEESRAGMQSTEEPPNHGGIDLSELPPMHEASLNEQQVRTLFSDLAACATDVRLHTRRAGNGQVQPSLALDHARDQFLGGALNRLQIRYRWQDAQWIDTLERRSDVIRLIRIRHG